MKNYRNNVKRRATPSIRKDVEEKRGAGGKFAEKGRIIARRQVGRERTNENIKQMMPRQQEAGVGGRGGGLIILLEGIISRREIVMADIGNLFNFAFLLERAV